MQSSVQVYALLDLVSPASHPGVKVYSLDSAVGLVSALETLGLGAKRPTLVIVGGASGLDDAQRDRLQSLFDDVLAPLAEELQLYVVDGGTDAGVMRMMGEARTHIGGSFRLIGVAPRELVHLPDAPASHPDASTLEPHHTHCLLVPGDRWGAESPWIAEVATQLSGELPSMTVLINGGSVTWQDANASVQAGREILIMAGSGRTADIMAAALNGSSVDDPRISPLMASGLLSAIDLEAELSLLKRQLHTLLTTEVHSPHAEERDIS